MNTFEKAFERLHTRYCKILENYYPAHGSTGFTERNLTNNFIISIENILGENSISWLEAPIDIEKKKHIDAVVFDIKEKSSFMIESKRFSNPEQKIREANNDIVRMKDPKHYGLLEKNLRKIKIENRYAILLADVWRENEKKITIYEQWPQSVYQGQDVFWANKLQFESLNYSLLILAVKL